MKLPFRTILVPLLCITAFSLLPINDAFACTTLAIKAEDGSVVCGRTMEWGSFDLHSRVAIVPRGHRYTAVTPDGKPGLSWETRYGMVGLDILRKDYLAEGMNERGLVASSLFHPGFAEYQPYDPASAEISMGVGYLVNYILSLFSGVDEVRDGLKAVRVVPVPEAALGGIPAPMHVMVTEASGRSIVIEYLQGVLTVFDNPLRVMTNAPSFDWHMTNVRNYLGFSAFPLPTRNIEGIRFAPLGAGSGLAGIPGDFTPPSRFVRAVVFSQLARKTPDGTEAVYEMFRILDGFNLPLGASEGSAEERARLQGMRSSTIWTSAADSRSLRLYFHTQHNRRVRMVDLSRIDFSSGGGIEHLPMDRKPEQDVEDLTPGS